MDIAAASETERRDAAISVSGASSPAAKPRYGARGWLLSDLGLDARVEFAELLGITLPTSRQYQTFAGFLLNKFGAIPNVGDKIEVEGWRFEIVDLDGRRIDKALASRLEP